VSASRRLIVDTENLFTEAVGEAGVRPEAVSELGPRLADLRGRLAAAREGGEPTFFGLPFDPAHLETAREWGGYLTTRFHTVIVLGMGGSSLGGEMLARCLGRQVAGRTGYPQVRFIDNVDPDRMEAELDGIEWGGTAVLAVSKSGGTAETLAQLLTLIPRMERALGRPALAEHLVAVTENAEGALGRVARDLHAPVVHHPPVGGRYSVLSPVGLLPGYVAGVDVEGLVAGAARMAEACLSEDMADNPALWSAGAQYLLGETGRTQSVYLPYFERLDWVTRWFRQLWAESLGKLDAEGHHRGLTPVRALGATDQHSQLQLYLQGPTDKQFTLLMADDLAHAGDRIPERWSEESAIAPLAGHTVGELLTAELQGTRETLTRNGRPNRTLRLPTLDAGTLGELIMLLEVETVAVAELLGIDAFDQPAVEESKVLTREYLAQMRG
jgi:glucose-6-phosphate isomerase